MHNVLCCGLAYSGRRMLLSVLILLIGVLSASSAQDQQLPEVSVAAAPAAEAEAARPLPDGWAQGSLPDGQVYYYPIKTPENIQWEHPGNEVDIAAAAEAAAAAAVLDLAKNEEKETLLAFRAAITDPDQMLRSWQRSSNP